MPRPLPAPSLMALALLAAGCLPRPAAARPPRAAPPFTCTAPPPAATPAPPPTRESARALSVGVLSGDLPDWAAWEAAAAPAAAAPAWGVASPAPAAASAPAAPAWGGATPAPAAPAWGVAPPAPAAAPPAAPAAGWGVATPPAASAAPRAQDWFDGVAAGIRLKIAADGAPLGSLALALGDKLALPVVVQAELADRSVTLSARDLRLSELSRLLREVHGVVLSFEDGVLVLSSFDAFVDRNYQTEPAPLETVLLPAPDGVNPAHLAATWCAMAATDRGTASVAGRAIVVQDEPAAIEAARHLLEEIDVAARALRLDDEARDSD